MRTGIVLAGGKSLRMGTDKGLIKAKGKMLIEHVIDAMKPLVNDIILVSNEKKYDQLGHRRVEDEFQNYGPLAGLYSGLKHSKSESNLVLSCDVPSIQTKVLKKLIEIDDSSYDVVQVESQHQTMPLIALYKKSCMKTFLTLLQKNERRLRFAVNQMHTKTLVLDSKWQELVRNFNTKEDLKAF
jgi:molybdopterin-guanine dinucleotide biosynthesis protein A